VRADADLDYTAAELVDGACERFYRRFLFSKYSKAPFSTLVKVVAPWR